MEKEAAAVPECSVCLQPYDASVIVPRVLSCGHSLCEFCISSLALCDERDEGHGRSLLRCPECNQRSKLQGLPKNFELLRFIAAAAEPTSAQQASAAAAAPEPTSTERAASQQALRSNPRPSALSRPSFVFEASILELCRWIIPQHAAEMVHPPSGQVLLCRGEETLECSCAAIFVPVKESRYSLKGCRNPLNYRQKVQSWLEGLPAHEVKDLLHLLRAQEGVFGIWMDVEQDRLYLVHKALTECEQLAGFLKSDDALRLSNAFLKRGMEICEVFMHLHKRRVVAGLVTPLCLGSSDFTHVQLNVSALFSERSLFKQSIEGVDPAAITTLSKDDVLSQSIDSFPFFYASPELVMGMRKFDTLSRCDIACTTDSWTLACLFCKYLFGRTPWDGFTIEEFLEKSAPDVQHAQSWIRHHLDLDTAKGDCSVVSVHIDFVRTLMRCFSCSPSDRPCTSEIWHVLNCVQNLSNNTLVSSSNRDSTMCCEAGAGASTLWCLALGCTINTTTKECILEKQDSSDPCVGISCRAEEHKAAEVQKYGNLEAHVGDITCLAVCGQYLLSASLDKTICVWSLKDDTLIKSLKGHTQKVMALASDEQMSVIISGDYGGELFAWDLESTATSCHSKWHHHQDWRYSGVASLAISLDGQLYSGAGDKVIKVWSLQDFGLIAIMEGHKSLISALLVDKEVLFSGSWDGTIRLWWRRDHCPMSVLNETMKLGAVLALASLSDLLLVGYQSGKLQVWKDETCMNSIAAHESSISSLCSYQDTLYSGSWDETVKAWKLDELLHDATPTFVAKCGSAIKSLVCYDKRLFVGLTSKAISVFTKTAC